MADGRVRISPFPLLLHRSPRLWQLEQGNLSSHLMRWTRHESQALATWLRLGFTVAEDAGEGNAS